MDVKSIITLGFKASCNMGECKELFTWILQVIFCLFTIDNIEYSLIKELVDMVRSLSYWAYTPQVRSVLPQWRSFNVIDFNIRLDLLRYW